MPTEIRGVTYFTQKEVLSRIRRERTTLWRWRKGGKVPMGSSSTSKQVYFTAAEAAAIETYALEVEPIEVSDPTQMPLFNTTEARS